MVTGKIEWTQSRFAGQTHISLLSAGPSMLPCTLLQIGTGGNLLSLLVKTPEQHEQFNLYSRLSALNGIC